MEITAAGKSSHPTRYRHGRAPAGELRQLRPTESATGNALYVKVYARLADCPVKFHKDGYTDRRGRFDYASGQQADAAAHQPFSGLVLSEERGP